MILGQYLSIWSFVFSAIEGKKSPSVLIVIIDFEIIMRCSVFSESFYFSIKRMENDIV